MPSRSFWSLSLPVVAGLGLLSAVPAAAKPFWAQVAGVNLTTQNLDWEKIASTAATQPAATAVTFPGPFGPSNRIDIFFRDSQKCLNHYVASGFGQDFASQPMPGPCDTDFDGPVTAAAWDNSGRIDLFWFSGFVGVAGQPHPVLMHRWNDGANWHSESLGATATIPTSVPTVASWGIGRLDVFWRDTTNQVRWLGFQREQKGKPGFTPGGWFNKERVVAGNVTGEPTAVERTTNIIDLFWKNSNGKLEHMYTGNGGTAWSGIQALNVAANTPPSAASWGAKRIDVVYGVDSTHLGHLWIDGGAGNWDPKSETLYSSTTFAAPVAAAGPSHAGRLDVFGSSGGTNLSHTLYQDTLPGFVGVGEGNNGGEGLWCWASAAISVVDYETGAKHLSCEGVNKALGITTCCNNPKAPKACLVGGSTKPVLDAYGVSYKDMSGTLPLLALQLSLLVNHQPVISYHAHPDGGGHDVHLVDTYRLHGADMVVIYGTQFDANWVMPYSEYIHHKETGWTVTDMVVPQH